jgi:hypothetical protein
MSYIKPMDQEIKKLTLDEAIAKVNSEHGFKQKDGAIKFTLWYGDYRDRFESPKGEVEEIVKTGYCESFFEGEWLYDSLDESVRQMLSSTFPDDEYDIEDIKDGLRIYIQDHDDSDVLGHYLKQSGPFLAYYDLGIEMDSFHYDSSGLNAAARSVTRRFGLSKDHEKDVKLMLTQASGGMLVILFSLNPEEFYGDPVKDPKWLTFSDPVIAVMDRFNGSGDFMEATGAKVKVPFRRERIRLDEAASGYSFGQVFGHIDIDCKAVMSNKGEDHKGIVPVGDDGPTPFEIREAAYDKSWKEGKCTMGDMNMRRHKDSSTSYINDFPCGTRCKDCGTFWID